MRFKIVYLLVSIAVMLFSCSEPKVRKPIQHAGTQNFYKALIAKKKKLNLLEKKQLELWMQKDTIANYISSTNGFWYAYVKKDSSAITTPVKGNSVKVKYIVTTINDVAIYKEQEKIYKVDEEEFIPGLEEGIKLMKKGETITFVIPSYIAYGVTGDGYKIKINQPIKSTVTLLDIKSNK